IWRVCPIVGGARAAASAKGDQASTGLRRRCSIARLRQTPADHLDGADGNHARKKKDQCFAHDSFLLSQKACWRQQAPSLCARVFSRPQQSKIKLAGKASTEALEDPICTGRAS